MSHVNALSVFVFLQRSDFTVQLHQIWDSESCPVPAPFWTRRHETCRFNSCITRAPNRKVSCIIETCRDCLWTFYIIYIYICTLYIHILCNCLWRSAKSQLNSKGYPSWNPDHPSMGYITICGSRWHDKLFDMASTAAISGPSFRVLESFWTASPKCVWVWTWSLETTAFFDKKKRSKNRRKTKTIRPRYETLASVRKANWTKADSGGPVTYRCEEIKAAKFGTIRHRCKYKADILPGGSLLFIAAIWEIRATATVQWLLQVSRVQEIHQHTTSTGPWGKCPWPFGTAAMAPHDTPTWHSDMVPQLGRTWHRDMAPNHNSQA